MNVSLVSGNPSGLGVVAVEEEKNATWPCLALRQPEEQDVEG